MRRYFPDRNSRVRAFSRSVEEVQGRPCLGKYAAKVTNQDSPVRADRESRAVDFNSACSTLYQNLSARSVDGFRCGGAINRLFVAVPGACDNVRRAILHAMWIEGQNFS